ncbi:unnamed protein product [Ectocarpus sp. 6 AP-2014]
MALRNRKLVIRANLCCFDLSTILESVRTQCPKLIYLGIWYRDGFVYVYVQGAERMSDIMLTKALEGHMVIEHISTYDAPGGELQEEWRAKPVRGNKKIEVKSDTTAVFVNPLGKESLRHITGNYVADLLRPLPGIDVFYKFGLKLYSLHQNINFRARKGTRTPVCAVTATGGSPSPEMRHTTRFCKSWLRRLEKPSACSDRRFRHTTSITSTCIQTASSPTRTPPYPSKGRRTKGGATRFSTTSLSA